MRRIAVLAWFIASALVAAVLVPRAWAHGLASGAGARDAPCCDVRIIVEVPENSGDVYLAGSLDELGPWRADGVKMTGEGRLREVVIRAPLGAVLEYKFTQGDWSREGTGPSGTVMANFRLEVKGDATERREVVDWKKDPEAYVKDVAGAGVVGDLVYWEGVASEFLPEPRRVSVWTPPGYAENPGKRYRVLYMSDGQNLFDPRIANTGVDWGVDEAIASLASEGLIDPPIVVASWSSSMRGADYSPWALGPQYARFLIEELMPRVNREFRTLTGPQNTYHMGSSMGGLISMYLATRRPDAFGGCGCISTHLPLSPKMVAEFFPGAPIDAPDDAEPYFVKDINAGWPIPEGARLWFDYGTKTLDANYEGFHDTLRAHLVSEGLVEGEDFVMRKYEGALHNEASWRARLKDPLLWLYGK